MAKPGPRRQPTAIKLARGTHQRHRDGKPELEPGKPLETLPAAPNDFGLAAKAAWGDIGSRLMAGGYFTGLDVHAFEQFCRLHDDLADCNQAIERDGAYQTTDKDTIVQHPGLVRKYKIIDLLRRYEGDFWLNPTARAGKQAVKPQQKLSTRKCLA